MHLRTHDRLRMKSISAWKVFKEIKEIQMPITHNYTRRLLFDRLSQDLFIEIELEERFDEEGVNL